jgi:hypothetical protein
MNIGSGMRILAIIGLAVLSNNYSDAKWGQAFTAFHDPRGETPFKILNVCLEDEDAIEDVIEELLRADEDATIESLLKESNINHPSSAKVNPDDVEKILQNLVRLYKKFMGARI